MVRGMPVIDRVVEYCDGCTLGKKHRAPFPQATTFRAERGTGSRYMWLELLTSKDEAFDRFKKVQAMTEGEGDAAALVRSTGRGEFNSMDFRKAMVTAVYILNRAPTRSLESVTPYKAWHGRKPNVQHLRTFGCMVHVKNVGPGITKLSDRSAPMIFVGYEVGSKCYRVYNPATKKVQVTRDVLFEENRQWDWSTPAAPTHAVTGWRGPGAPGARTAHATFTWCTPLRTGMRSWTQHGHGGVPSHRHLGHPQVPHSRPHSLVCTPPTGREIRWATTPHDDALERTRALHCATVASLRPR
ncbi:hypothetical protein QYE76_024319 [Lolium multiflorum]|uniref:Retroviral polymerase SH3-like domain-containing protein n=1 Tax=Lolium multiflorum TaxID=4521 RepID=A0AAD8RD34_LOLMU|nr:hypothetical protein QYE76_024319 [Lolium multiflorum]